MGVGAKEPGLNVSWAELGKKELTCSLYMTKRSIKEWTSRKSEKKPANCRTIDTVERVRLLGERGIREVLHEPFAAFSARAPVIEILPLFNSAFGTHYESHN